MSSKPKTDSYLIVKNKPASDASSKNLANIDIVIKDDKGRSVLKENFRPFPVKAFDPIITEVTYNAVYKRLTKRGKYLVPTLFYYTINMKPMT